MTKKNVSKLSKKMGTGALVMALMAGAMLPVTSAWATTQETAPAIEQAQPEAAPAENSAQAPEAAPAENSADAAAGDAAGTQTPESTDDSAALQEAFDAYRTAKQESRTADLEAELKEYVEAGKLTQEQADLILNAYKERAAQKNGSGMTDGKGFRMNGRGGKGGRRGNDFGRGGMSGFGGQGNQNPGGTFLR